MESIHSIDVNPKTGSKCYKCGAIQKKGDENLFYEEMAQEGSSFMETNIICYRCRQEAKPRKATKSKEVLLHNLCRKYEIQDNREVGWGECGSHVKPAKLWDTETGKLICAKCVVEKEGKVQVG